MNHKGNEFFSRVEKDYDVKLKRQMRCPICREEGKAQENNPLVMEHRVDTDKGIIFHRWSYSTGRLVNKQAEETNVL